MVRTVSWRRVLSLLLCGWALQPLGLPGGPSPASAAEPPKLLVLPVGKGNGTPDEAPGRLESLLRRELANRSGLRVVQPSARAQRRTGGGSRGLGPDAHALLAEGQKQLAALRVDAAVKLLQRGLLAAAAHPAEVEFSGVLEGHVALAEAQFRLGNESKAESSLMQLLRLAPSYQPPPGRFPPVFLRELEKARKRSAKQGQGSLDIQGPPGARVFVDGRDLGTVPVTAESLPFGAHYVILEGEGGERWGRVVEVKEASEKVVAAFPAASSSSAASDRPAPLGPTLEAAALSRAAALAKAHGADAVLATQLYRVSDHSLGLGAAVYLVKEDGFVGLPSFIVDAPLVTAQTEVFRLVDAMEGVVLGRAAAPVASLPLELVSGAAAIQARLPEETASAGKGKEPELAVVAPRSVVRPSEARPLEPAKDAPTSSASSSSSSSSALTPERIRSFDGSGRRGGPGTRSQSDEGLEDEPSLRQGKVAWWVWALGGVGLAAAAAGTYYGVSQATQPVTGTVKASW